MDHGNDDDPTIGELRRRRAAASRKGASFRRTVEHAHGSLPEPCPQDELDDDAPTVLGPVSPEDDIIARARAEGKTHKEAGALVNRSERTARRRMKKPAVRRLYEEYRWENRQRFVAAVEAAAPKAVETVTAELDSDVPNLRLHAGNYLMNKAERLYERGEQFDPALARSMYGAALRNYIEACKELLPSELLEQVLNRITDLNATTELLAVEEAQPTNMKIVIEEQDPSEAPTSYAEAGEEDEEFELEILRRQEVIGPRDDEGGSSNA
jgi:hypothetical protein